VGRSVGGFRKPGTVPSDLEAEPFEFITVRRWPGR